MDANKLDKLREIGYEITPSCGTCKNYIGADFGECSLHTHVHKKHSGGPRQLSVFRYGRCDGYERASWVDDFIHGFKEFIR